MSLEDGFWETLHLLIGWKKTGKDARDDVDDWVNKVVGRTAADFDQFEEDFDVISIGSNSEAESISKQQQINNFVKSVQLPPILCKFSHPHVRSRLEKLMGSNVVSLTDRGYMQRLQERILEDYAQNMCKRIATRQAEEMERVKNLVLIGKIPLEHAPPEMANHPVMLIEMYCNKLIDERRAKIKLQKIHIPNYLYWDDTPDPPSGLCIEKGHAFRKNDQSLCTSPERLLIPTEEEEIENRYMFSSEEFENMKYEDPLIKDLKECETVEEMYALADEIIGVLKTITERKEEFTEMQLLESLNQPRESCPPEVPPEPSGRRMSVRPIPTL